MNEGCSDLLQSPTPILQVHLPSSLEGRHWVLGLPTLSLPSDVVAGTPVLAGAAQLTVSPMAPRWAKLLAAA